MKNLIYSVALLVTVGLVGCGGGGSSSAAVTEPSSPVVETPIVVENTATKSTVTVALPTVPQIPAGN